MRVASLLVGLAVLGFLAGTAPAALIAGGSFESPDVADGTNDVVDATGQTWSDSWSSSDNGKVGFTYGAGREDPSTNKTGQTGDQYAKMEFAAISTQDQWVKIISPSLGTAAASYTYTFDVDMTWDKAWAVGSQPSLSTIWGSSNKLTLFVNGQAFDRDHGTLPEDTFTARSIEVVVDASGNLLSTDADGAPAIGTPLAGGDIYAQLMAGRLRSTGGSGPTFMLFDDAQFDAVPEPVSLSLLGLGALGMFIRRRRK